MPRALICAVVLTVAAPAVAQDPPAWTRATAPFHIVGPIYYVGSEGLAAYLIKTSKGAILIDATLAENAPLVEANIERVGVKMHDVKYLLLSHAHGDHAGGLKALKAASGATLITGAEDRAAVEAGRPTTDNPYNSDFPAAQVDRVVRDGDVVRLGDVALTARSTPGHTAGCTTWTMRVNEGKRRLNVVFPCSLTVAGNRLFGNRETPNIVAVYRASFAKVAALPADVVLPAHPEFADVLERHARGGVAAWIDPGLLKSIVAEARVSFDAELAKQKAAR